MVTVKVCPKCGSENVKIDPTNVRSAVGLSQPHYLCLDCGFSGQFFPEIDKDIPKFGQFMQESVSVQGDVFMPDALDLIRWFGHASFMFTDRISGNKIYYVDPFEFKGDGKEKADIIFITHAHQDHCDASSVRKILKPTTIIAVPKGCRELLNLSATFMDVEPNREYEISGFKFRTVPAYNIRPERLQFHPRSNNWLGYIFELNNQTVYHAGDTDFIPEMKQLGKVDIAFIPMGGTYGMDVDEAIQAANAVKASITVPMHYRRLLNEKSTAAEEKFKAGVKNSRVVIMDEVA